MPITPPHGNAPLLGMNIDHVATIRQARYRPGLHVDEAVTPEPDPVQAAFESEIGGAFGGADIITVHLREDRRHIIDRDLQLIRRLSRLRLNLEMGATEEMIGIACALKDVSGRCPDMCTLVPEGRQEVTTEGGLDIRGQLPRMKEMVGRLRAAGILVSAFIDADGAQIEASAAAGFQACEIHTGPYAAAFARCGGDFSREELLRELDRVAEAGRRVIALGVTGGAGGAGGAGARMRFHAGHALNYQNVGPIARLPGIAELHIGHAIVSRAVFVGLRTAVGEMKRAILAAAVG